MYLTIHAKGKMDIYGIGEEQLFAGLENPEMRYRDVVSETEVYLIGIDNKNYLVILSEPGERIITVYPPDPASLENRIRKGRWICR